LSDDRSLGVVRLFGIENIAKRLITSILGLHRQTLVHIARWEIQGAQTLAGRGALALLCCREASLRCTGGYTLGTCAVLFAIDVFDGVIKSPFSLVPGGSCSLLERRGLPACLSKGNLIGREL